MENTLNLSFEDTVSYGFIWKSQRPSRERSKSAGHINYLKCVELKIHFVDSQYKIHARSIIYTLRLSRLNDKMLPWRLACVHYSRNHPMFPYSEYRERNLSSFSLPKCLSCDLKKFDLWNTFCIIQYTWMFLTESGLWQSKMLLKMIQLVHHWCVALKWCNDNHRSPPESVLVLSVCVLTSILV